MELTQDIKFSNWKKFHQRAEIDNCNKPGIYMIAISTNELHDTVPDFSDVKYIGMTNSIGGLLSRWRQFQSGLIRGVRHSGANTIWEEYSDLKQDKDDSIYDVKTSKIGKNETVYVCGFPVECNTKEPTENDLRIMGKVAYLEYEVMARYYEFAKIKEKKTKPMYNKK
jgi:hypothetical protein